MIIFSLNLMNVMQTEYTKMSFNKMVMLLTL